ncbi:MAG: D-alanine--D-alanine ligase, partial [Chloroflexota bacterium]
LDILGIPYVGSGVLASALAMDKAMSKTVLAAHGLDVPRGAIVTAADHAGDPERAARDAQAIGYPVVVKPVRQGSSFGISIVERPDQLAFAIAEALRYDDRALIEERIEGRELTCGVIGNEELVALPVIEIRTARPFFDYRAKYDPSASEEICPAPIPPEIAQRAQDASTRAHRALGCRGFSRTDLMWTPSPQGASPHSTPVGPGRLAVLEVNTIPGMTSNSLLPKAAQVAGIPFAELLERLVRWAMEDRGR